MLKERQVSEPASWQSRTTLGREIHSQLAQGSRIAYIGNTPHALPEEARIELSRHSGSVGAYEGRMPWVAASYNLPQPPLVIMQEKPYESEIRVLGQACQQLGILVPDILYIEGGFPYDADEIKRLANLDNGTYHHPFIGSELYSNGSSERILPNSQEYQNKARMREHLPPHNRVPGIPVLANGNSKRNQLLEVRKAILDQEPGIQRAKVATTASGMSTVVFDSERFHQQAGYRREVLGTLYPDYLESYEQPATEDIIVEQEIDFGEEGGYGDFGFRGYVLPNGEFILTSVGRVISTEAGVYQGMFMATLEDSKLIGLSQEGFDDGAQVMEAFSKNIQKQGYVGPVNLDIFENSHEDKLGKVHDFNMRDGGSSASGAFCKLVNPGGVVLDIDLHLKSGKLSEGEVDNMVQKLWEEHNVIAYSTTFLRHPVEQNDGSMQYTVKLMMPVEGTVHSDSEGRERITQCVENLNNFNVVNGTFVFED